VKLEFVRKLGGVISGFRALRSLKNRDYRFYLFGSICQFACLSMQIITGPLLMFRISGSPALLGTMALVSALPMIFLSMYGGAIADRIPKKRVVIVCLLGSALLAILLGVMLYTGFISSENPGSWVFLIITALLMGSLMGVMMPALQAIVAEIVDREELMNAVALNTMGMNILALVAPAIAGFIIDAFDFDAVYFTQAGLYICGAILMSFLPVTRRSVTSGTNILEEIRQGFQYIRQDRMILFVLGFSLVVTVLAMPYQQLLPIYVDDILKVGATGMGVLMSLSGAGALVGSIILATLPNKKRGLMLMISGIVAGMSLVVFAFSTMWTLSLSIMVFIGLSHAFRMTIGSTLLQAYAEPEYRGRVLSIFGMQWGFMSVVTFVAGLLAEALPVQWILGSLAMLLIVLSVLAIIFITSMRKLD